MCRAAVPLLVAMANRFPFQALNSSSKARQLGPKLWLVPFSDASTIARSLAWIGGQDLISPAGTAWRPP